MPDGWILIPALSSSSHRQSPVPARPPSRASRPVSCRPSPASPPILRRRSTYTYPAALGPPPAYAPVARIPVIRDPQARSNLPPARAHSLPHSRIQSEAPRSRAAARRLLAPSLSACAEEFCQIPPPTLLRPGPCPSRPRFASAHVRRPDFQTQLDVTLARYGRGSVPEPGTALASLSLPSFFPTPPLPCPVLPNLPTLPRALEIQDARCEIRDARWSNAPRTVRDAQTQTQTCTLRLRSGVGARAH